MPWISNETPAWISNETPVKAEPRLLPAFFLSFLVNRSRVTSQDLYHKTAVLARRGDRNVLEAPLGTLLHTVHSRRGEWNRYERMGGVSGVNAGGAKPSTIPNPKTTLQRKFDHELQGALK